MCALKKKRELIFLLPSNPNGRPVIYKEANCSSSHCTLLVQMRRFLNPAEEPKQTKICFRLKDTGRIAATLHKIQDVFFISRGRVTAPALSRKTKQMVGPRV